MTAGAPLPADNEAEDEAPIAKVLRAAMLAEEAQNAPPSAEDTAPEAAAGEPEAPQTAADEASEQAQTDATEETAASAEVAEPDAAEDDTSPVEIEQDAEQSIAVEAHDAAEDVEPPGVGEATELETAATVQPTPEAIAAWTEALHSVERSINEAAEAIRFLRSTLQQMAPLLRSLDGLEDALSSFGEPRRPVPLRPVDGSPADPTGYGEAAPEPAPAASSYQDGTPPVQRDWAARRKPVVPPQKERASKWEEVDTQWTQPGPSRPAPKPVTLVPDDTPAPYAYKVTIEDRQNSVELLQLHRAFAGISSVRNVSLLNYVNGIASLSLETAEELQMTELEAAIKKVMKRSCSVVPHESNVILIQVGD